jgi:hypothetical protein
MSIRRCMRQETDGALVNIKLEIVQVYVQVQVHVRWTLSQPRQQLLQVCQHSGTCRPNGMI